MKIRLARRGEGEAVARLGELALQGHTQGSATGSLAEAIDRSGGNLKVPFGRAYAFVAEEAGAVTGLLYVTPPVRMAEANARRGEAWQKKLAWKAAELQLLAVDEDCRGRGVASRLLEVGQESLRQRGCVALLVKILDSDAAVVGWYRRRGYTVLGMSEYAVLRVGGHDVPVTSTGDGYLAGVKLLAREG